MDDPISIGSIQVIALVRRDLVVSSVYAVSLLLDMDCDGLKKGLLTDTDGSLLGQPSSVFSEAEYLWGKLKFTVPSFCSSIELGL